MAERSERASLRRRSTENEPLIDGKEIPYPKSVFFIIVTEFCERFSYTGMRTILTMYIRNVLYRGVSNAEDIATVIYHSFVSLCFFTPLLGGIIADSFFGKYKTILYISILYAIGNCTLALSAVTPLHLPKIPFALMGLVLIGIGTGGIKPCANAFAGDQFKLPEQGAQLQQFFFFFYFAINSGSLLSNFVTPVMRRDVRCFGYDTCYSLAFATPALFWILAILIFVSGSQFYKIKRPEGNVFVQVGGCIWYALTTNSNTRENRSEHWLDGAREKFSTGFIEDVKVLLRIIVLISPLPIYWALYEQQGSTWTLQAARMKGYISPYLTLKPDQMQAANSFLILFFIPLFEVLIYPLLNKCRILTTSLQRMCFGCLLLSLAFVISGIVELQIEPTYPVLPTSSESTLDFINALPCPIHVSMKNIDSNEASPLSRIIQPYENYKFEKIPIAEYNISSEVWNLVENCEMDIEPSFNTFRPCGAKAYSTFLTTDANKEIKVSFSEDDLDKSREGNAKLKVMYEKMSYPNATLELTSTDGTEHYMFNLNPSQDYIKSSELQPRMYELYLIEGNRRKRFEDTLLDEGGSYVMALFPEPVGHGVTVELDSNVELKVFVLTPPNSVHMAYLLPQYVVLTLAELFFSITGFTFAYTQAPASMKAVIQSLWLLTIGLGSALVVFITAIDIFERPALQFFSYSVIMLFGTVLFTILAYYYKPNDDACSRKSSPCIERRENSRNVTLDVNGVRAMAVNLSHE